MCTCASCEHTDGFADKGFAAWPRGNPAGRKAASEYAAHVRHAGAWGKDRVPEIPAGIWTRPPFPCTGTTWSDPGKARSYPTAADAKLGTAHYVAQFLRANGYRYKKPEAAEAAPARPTQPGKAAQHLPELNRQPEPHAILYVMKQGKSPFMTVSQAAEKLECSPARILQWIHADRLPGSIKPARDWLIPANAKRPEELPRGRPKAAASR